MLKLQKVGIVTGGASGIGRAICKRLAAKMVYVIIIDINVTKGEALMQEIVGQGGQGRFVYADVAEARSIQTVIQEVFDEFGRLDYVFNNAGISMYGEFHHMNLEDWNKIININLWGVINGTYAAYPLMKKQGFGYIANTASAAGLGPTPMVSAYATTKHAVVGFTTSLHYEAEAYGIKISVLCPGHVDTPIYDNGIALNLDKDKINKSVKQRKMMSPDEFAAIALKGLESNVPLICPIPLRKTMNLFFDLFPSAHRKLMRMICRIVREARLE